LKFTESYFFLVCQSISFELQDRSDNEKDWKESVNAEEPFAGNDGRDSLKLTLEVNVEADHIQNERHLK
jgi:hypothetical protein